MSRKYDIFINGQLGTCGHLQTFLGFAPAYLLYSQSFADTLSEDTGIGYQRPRNVSHSRSFRQYIGQPETSTIPLTFNLRKPKSKDWQIKILDKNAGYAVLQMRSTSKPLAQVDCQHRIGELNDLDIPLAFMAFIGLDLRAEMALFTIINSKAKGLSSSLTDYHESNLLTNLSEDAPHLYIARRLNDDSNSPWYQQIRYGGETNSGLKRRSSFRMVQKTVHKFLREIDHIPLGVADDIYQLIAEYWWAIRQLFPKDWANPRKSLLTKGIGLYSLMRLLPELLSNTNPIPKSCNEYTKILAPLASSIDWASKGMFAGAGGQKGVAEVYQHLKKELT